MASTAYATTGTIDLVEIWTAEPYGGSPPRTTWRTALVTAASWDLGQTSVPGLSCLLSASTSLVLATLNFLASSRVMLESFRMAPCSTRIPNLEDATIPALSVLIASELFGVLTLSANLYAKFWQVEIAVMRDNRFLKNAFNLSTTISHHARLSYT